MSSNRACSLLAVLALGGCFDPAPTPAEDESSGGSTDEGTTSGQVPITTGIDSTSGIGESEESGGPAVCGDGMVGGSEDCDDMGESALCNADCTAAACGDGVINAAAAEVCDDGGESARCNDDCTAAACGDGVINTTAGETCDDAGPSETCNASCTMISCGDGFLDAGEECDEGGKSTAACDVDCTFAECGDGVFNEAAEDCDEGERSATCDADCTAVECGDAVVNLAAGELCDTGMQSAMCDLDCTPAECGDGYPNGLAGELCDDGGESAFCNVDCTISACGDAVVNASDGEQCDAAGESAGCDLDCTLPVCGDGVLNASAGEQCEELGAALCTYDAVTLINEDFSDNLAGWTLGAEWGIGPAVSSPSPGACANGDPGTDHTPTGDNGVAGVVIGGNAGTALHDFYWLTSPVFNASGYGLVELDLWRWLNSDYTRYMQNRIQVWDGAAWQTVWESGPSPGIADAVWTNVVYDVTAHANANMQVRIGFNIASGGVYTCSQWNVDDLTIIGSDCL
jgi:hypothetical protein